MTRAEAILAWRAQRRAFVLEIDTPPERDREGKTGYTLTWTGYRHDLGADGPRAQCFLADLDANLARMLRQGATVTAREGDDAAREAIERAGGVDKPAVRESWNVHLDGLIRDGLVSEERGGSWSPPPECA